MLVSIGDGCLVVKRLVRSSEVVLNEPLREILIRFRNVIQTNLRQLQPFFLEGAVEALQGGIILGLSHPVVDLRNAKKPTGLLEFPGKFTAIIGVHDVDLAVREVEQAIEEILGIPR